MPRHFWKHHVTLDAIHAGVPAEFIDDRFSERMNIWYGAGETVAGAVDMITFTWKQSRVEERADHEANGLRRMLKEGCRG